MFTGFIIMGQERRQLMNGPIRAYADLLRVHFFFAWPLLFCSGFFLAANHYGTYTGCDIVRVGLIGFFGFEAGFVLNDYVDREYDRKDIEARRLTRYWRIFGTRPIPAGLISPRNALLLFAVLAALTIILAATLPYPHSLFVLAIMAASYGLEIFYQVRKRNQNIPLAQLAGRIDLALFPVAGYLSMGFPDMIALAYLLFFYPFAEAHLGINDLVDEENDRARGMNTITTLYGPDGTVAWILVFLAIHGIFAVLFMTMLGWIARAGILAGILLISCAGAVLVRHPGAGTALKQLPLFHLAMLLYAASLVLDSVC